MTDRDLELDRVASELEIRAVLARYARGVDRRRWELVASCFHEGATEHHGAFGRGTAAQFLEWAKEKLAGFESSSHLICNQLIEVEGDRAASEAYCVATHRTRAEGGVPARDLVAMVRYLDRFERRDGAWRIAHRVCVFDPGRVDPVAEPYPIAPGAAVGGPGAADPSHGMFAGG